MYETMAFLYRNQPENPSPYADDVLLVNETPSDVQSMQRDPNVQTPPGSRILSLTDTETPAANVSIQRQNGGNKIKSIVAQSAVCRLLIVCLFIFMRENLFSQLKYYLFFTSGGREGDRKKDKKITYGRKLVFFLSHASSIPSYSSFLTYSFYFLSLTLFTYIIVKNCF